MRSKGPTFPEAATTVLRSTGYGQARAATVAQLAGLDLEVEVTRVIADEIIVKVPDASVEVRWTAADWASSEPSQIVRRIERRLARLEDEHAIAASGGERAGSEAERARARLGQGFEHAQALSVAQRRQLEINQALSPTSDDATPECSSPGRVHAAPVPA